MHHRGSSFDNLSRKVPVHRQDADTDSVSRAPTLGP
jgi:hypothetical protein